MSRGALWRRKQGYASGSPADFAYGRLSVAPMMDWICEMKI